VDPKMVELANFNSLPHMLMPVVTDSKKAALTLQGVVMEMENRYNLLATAGVRNIHAFNTREYNPEEKLDGKPLPKKMPYIVVVIDELADLMLVARDKVETTIQRLAQLSRAVGVHLVLATQKPCVEVITGVIKANLPARIAFQVTSKVDSRVILDTGGADKLLGKGDMLFQPPGAPKPIRAQSTFINDKDIKLAIDFLKPFRAPKYVSAIGEVEKGGGGFGGADMEKDELYEDALRVVIETQQASVSTLQRRLGLGYARAARIMDMMEQQGIVGPPRGAKPRDILIGRETEEVSS
jgi:S-DNA-T family DNA segregation ATPase FtsK/SpoIIIE